MPSPAPALDPVIHPINRLRICTVLRSFNAVISARTYLGAEVRFSDLSEAVGLSDSALSKQLSALEQAGYVHRRREYASLRRQDVVWVSLTPAGLGAYEGHLGALREIAEAPPAPSSR